MSTMRPRLTSLLFVLAAAGLVACGGSSSKAYSPSAPMAGGGPTTAGAAPEAEESGAYKSPSRADYAPQQPSPPPASGARAEKWNGVAQTAPAPGAAADMAKESAAPPSMQPGLATQWGENRTSRVSSATFYRADPNAPFAMFKVFYNDRPGIDAMIQQWGGSPQWVTHFPVWQGMLDVALRGEGGEFLSGLEAGGNQYVTGEGGRRYSIVLRNNSPGRVEAVVSVDGLDVIKGEPAGLTNRGYLISAHDTLEIEGFRRSEAEVAAFRFGTVSQSYADRKHGDTRNVGVIGVAFFHEQGDSPNAWLDPNRYQDTHKRLDANPFPQYAQPPTR